MTSSGKGRSGAVRGLSLVIPVILLCRLVIAPLGFSGRQAADLPLEFYQGFPLPIQALTGEKPRPVSVLAYLPAPCREPLCLSAPEPGSGQVLSFHDVSSGRMAPRPECERSPPPPHLN